MLAGMANPPMPGWPMDNNSVNSQWGYQLESEILLINELKEPDAATRRQLANQLKPIIAAPPEMLPINRKGLHPYMMANRLFVLAFSNDPVPISLASQDRRWFCVWSSAPRMDSAKAKKMWDWYRAAGFVEIARYLHTRDVSQFNPAAPPAMTEFKYNLIEHGMSMAESYLVDMLRNRAGEFSKGVIGSPFHSLCDRLAGSAPSGVPDRPWREIAPGALHAGAWPPCCCCSWWGSMSWPGRRAGNGRPGKMRCGPC